MLVQAILFQTLDAVFHRISVQIICYTPRKLCLLEGGGDGYTVFTLFVHLSVCASIRP